MLSNDGDADGDTLSAIEVTKPGDGTVVLNPDGSFTYTPVKGFAGTDSFTYNASDGSAASAPVTVTITVTNTPPVATGDSYDVPENAAGFTVASPGVLGNDSDADGDTITAILVNGTSNGTLVLNADGSFRYEPATDFIGTDTFTYMASDGIANSNVVTVILAVSDTPPTAVDRSYSVSENGVLNDRRQPRAFSTASLAPTETRSVP